MMRYQLFVTALLFLLFSLATVHAEENFRDKPPHPDGWYGYDESLPDLLNIKGLSYHEARPIIMGAGWTPLQTLQEGTRDHEMATEYGEGKLFWSRGYYELQACSGGITYCAFLFQNKKGDRLRVVTKGEEHEKQGKHPRFAEVAGYRFNP